MEKAHKYICLNDEVQTPRENKKVSQVKTQNHINEDMKEIREAIMCLVLDMIEVSIEIIFHWMTHRLMF